MKNFVSVSFLRFFFAYIFRVNNKLEPCSCKLARTSKTKNGKYEKDKVSQGNKINNRFQIIILFFDFFSKFFGNFTFSATVFYSTHTC